MTVAQRPSTGAMITGAQATSPLPSPAASAPCPCGRLAAATSSRKQAIALAWPQCCGPALDAAQPALATDAHALMRSRYSAFVLQRADYLLASWHPRTRPAHIEFEPGLKWLGLEVLSHTATHPQQATVTFVARSRLAGRAQRMHETSHFVYEAGQWWYVDGITVPNISQMK
jgi:SEC-C motif domain protein